jgi:hypothetical protein
MGLGLWRYIPLSEESQPPSQHAQTGTPTVRRHGKSLPVPFKCLLVQVASLSIIAMLGTADVPLSQREALVSFYNATGGAGWALSTNWLSGDPCSGAWYQVGCSSTTAVVYVCMHAVCSPFPGPGRVGDRSRMSRSLCNPALLSCDATGSCRLMSLSRPSLFVLSGTGSHGNTR